MAAAKRQQANGAKKCENGRPKTVRNRHPRKSALRPSRVKLFRFSHRFGREILVKFSLAHPNPGKRSTENLTGISRQISRHLWQRKTEKKFTSALLQGSCSDKKCLGAAQRGAQFHFISAVLRTFFFMQRKEPFLPQNLHPREGNPLKHSLRHPKKCENERKQVKKCENDQSLSDPNHAI